MMLLGGEDSPDTGEIVGEWPCGLVVGTVLCLWFVSNVSTLSVVCQSSMSVM